MSEPVNDKKAAKAAKKQADLEYWNALKPWQKIAWSAAGVAVVVGAVIFFSQSKKDTTATQSAPPAAAAGRTLVPQLTAAQQIDLFDGLRAINPVLVSYEQGAINNARNVCGALRDGSPPSVSKRFDKAPLTSSQETQIVALIRTTFCPW
ncbi:MAG: DUF732 domain-containing protein [Nakamurella sp.]